VGLALLALGYAIGSSIERALWESERAEIARDVHHLKDYIEQLRQQQLQPGHPWQPSPPERSNEKQ
jgi:hypothetical protein